MESSWCNVPLPPRPPLPSNLPSYDDRWIQLIEDRAACAEPALARYGIECIDTYRSGAAHPELSLDGVHFQSALARHHSSIFWRALCGTEDAQSPQERLS